MALTPDQQAAVERAIAKADGKAAEAAGAFVDTAMDEGALNEQLAKLAALPFSVYETKRVAEAKRLGMRAAILDQMVARLRPEVADEDEGLGAEIVLAVRTPASESVNGSALLTSLVAEIGNYIYLLEESKLAVALWIVASHAYEAFFIFPRLRLKSPTKGCGKSTLVDVIEALVNRPLSVSNIRGPSLFRVIASHRPTMLLDEADRFLNGNDDMISVIDSGHKKNGCVVRCVGDNNEPRAFNVWAPMVIAAIGDLTGTVEHRAITIDMQRKPHGVKLKRFRADRPTPALATLASQAARWALDHSADLDAADPQIPETIDNRESDNWRPLLAVAEAIGGDWAELARAAAARAAGEDVSEDELGARLLADIRSVFTTEVIHTSDLVNALVDKEASPWAEISNGRPLTAARLGKLLRGFRIRSEQVKKDGLNRHGYRRAAFERAFEAYTPAHRPPTPPQNATAATELKNKGFSAFQNATEEGAGSVLESQKTVVSQSGSPGSVLRGGQAHVGRRGLLTSSSEPNGTEMLDTQKLRHMEGQDEASTPAAEATHAPGRVDVVARGTHADYGCRGHGENHHEGLRPPAEGEARRLELRHSAEAAPTPKVAPARCAQCGAGDEPLWHLQPPNGDPPVWLHDECTKFWLKDHPQPKGRDVLVLAQVSEIVVEQPVEPELPWSTPVVEEITDPEMIARIRAAHPEPDYLAAGPDDDIRNIDLGWQQ